MKTFKFEIQELLSRVVTVEARNENEAYLKAKDLYNNEEIILDSSDVKSFNIKKVLSNDEETEKDNLIAEIVDYLYNEEKKHYEEFDDKKTSDHIFLKLEKIKEFI
jgi:1,2-phenylacetyl-CoA epoxidase PaaB subunit